MHRERQQPSTRRRVLALPVVALALALAACSNPGASPSTAGAASSSPTANIPSASSPASSASSASASASVAVVATVAPPAVQTAGKILFCSDLTSPPIDYVDSNSKPTGSDVAIGEAIAARLGLQAAWSNISFDGLIPALQANHCDAILSQLFDKPARREVINMVDYMNSSQSILVAAGNPKGIKSLADLSGDKVAVEDGTTIQSLLATQNDTFKAAGKPPITIVVFPKDTDALQQLQIGQVDAYGTTLESASYYIVKAPNTFEVAGDPFNKILTGVGVGKDNTVLTDAIQKALDAMKADGTSLKILTQYGLQGDALQ
jgi:polar amino acid transport system substrate-binding protein